MLVSCVIVLQVFALVILAQEQVKYNVISLLPKNDDAATATNMAVIVDDHPYPLEPTTSSSLLFAGSAPAAQHHYYYAKTKADGSVVEKEPFERQPFDGERTPNEHYNRSWNKWDITQLPNVLESLPSIHRIKSDLHNDGEIPTIHIVGDPKQIQNMHEHNQDDIQVMTNMTFIRLHDIKTFSNVEFELSGHYSRKNAKLAYNIKLPKKSDLSGYRRLKLRALGTDPSYIREDLGFKMIHAAGVPTTDSSFVRVYINDQPLGLFGFIEKYKNPWLRNEFADGNKDYQQGVLYQGKYGNAKNQLFDRISDLSYYGDSPSSYAMGQYKIAEDPSTGEPDYSGLIELTKFLDNPPANKDAWEAHFDMESVIRGIALELTLGFGDGYLVAADNYYVYQTAPGSSKYMFMLWDIDLILGSSYTAAMSHLETGDWHQFAGGLTTKRPLMKFVNVPEYANRLDELIREFNDKLLFGAATEKRIDDTVAMLKEDVAWDKTCPRVSQVSPFDFTDLAPLADLLGLMKKVDMDGHTVRDFNKRQRNDDVGFMQAINGPTGYDSLHGVKEFIKNKRRNIKTYYGNK